MKIIFRADDLGFSEAVNYGIRKAIVDGVITCTGLMPNMPYAAAGYALVRTPTSRWASTPISAWDGR